MVKGRSPIRSAPHRKEKAPQERAGQIREDSREKRPTQDVPIYGKQAVALIGTFHEVTPALST
jgi:hypothetical protein